MGQPLPLPERIPNPMTHQLVSLNQMGINIIKDLKNDTKTLMPYVKYTLPEGWRMVCESWRQDLPVYYIVDDSDMRRVKVSGCWKGTYDNSLRLCILEGVDITKYEPSEDKRMESSKTDAIALIPEFLEAVVPGYDLNQPTRDSPKSIPRPLEFTP